MANIKTYAKAREVLETETFGEHVGAIMFALRNGPQTREKVVAAVEKRLEGKTCQPAARIVSFQVPRMVEKGLISVTVVAAEAKPAKNTAAPVAKKAAKPAAKKATKKAAKKAKAVEPVAEANASVEVEPGEQD
jgi:hypothetical protein